MLMDDLLKAPKLDKSGVVSLITCIDLDKEISEMTDFFQVYQKPELKFFNAVGVRDRKRIRDRNLIGSAVSSVRSEHLWTASR